MASQREHGIVWCEETWNPIRGCSRVSAGCQHCYAETVAKRFSGPGQPYEGLINARGAWNGVVMAVPHILGQPLRWKRPRRIFVNSMSDLFHENLPDEEIDKIFAVMLMASHHTFQVLTKRPERMLAYLTSPDFEQRIALTSGILTGEASKRGDKNLVSAMLHGWNNRLGWPQRHVWLGVSVEDQTTANERIPILLQTPAAVRWISAEPLLGPIDLTNLEFPNERGNMECWDALDLHLLPGETAIDDSLLDWVVAGGESGKGARPMHPDWGRSLRDQCAAAGVPFLFKQWGEWVSVSEVPGPGEHHIFNDGATVRRIGKKLAGRRLDGRYHDGYPETKQ